MHKFFTSLFCLAGVAFFSACSPPATVPAPTETFVAAVTPSPVITSTLETIPTSTNPAPPNILDELNPQSQPLTEWNGIPVMPGAVAGDGNDLSYYYTVKATVDEVHAFYDKEMPKLGYSPLAVGDNQANGLLLFYQDSANNMFNISLFIKGEDVLVMIVK